MLWVGILLILSPTLFFLLDQTAITIPGDPLTISLVIGLLGLILLGASQRHDRGRLILAVILGVAVFALQLFGIASLVLP